MDIQKVAELVLSQYNSEKKLARNTKNLFRNIVGQHFRSFGHILGMSNSEFFSKVSEECKKIQPAKKRLKKIFEPIGDKAFLINDARKRQETEYAQLGNGDSELGQEFYELYLFG